MRLRSWADNSNCSGYGSKLEATLQERSKEFEKRKSWSHVERRAALLEWYNVTGTAKTKAVQDYLADLLERQRKFICFAHHQVSLYPHSSLYLWY